MAGVATGAPQAMAHMTAAGRSNSGRLRPFAGAINRTLLVVPGGQVVLPCTFLRPLRSLHQRIVRLGLRRLAAI